MYKFNRVAYKQLVEKKWQKVIETKISWFVMDTRVVSYKATK